jgi:hypothetical protein
MKTLRNDLRAWSWNDLIKMYKVYGRMVNEIWAIRYNMSASGLSFSHFDFMLGKEARYIDVQISLLDAEIARRNSLIGVI